jgi:hypothetical protein
MPDRIKDTSQAETERTPQNDSDELIGVFRFLADQHDDAATLFGQLLEAPESRALLWPQIRRALVAHEHGEVRELYPVLRQLEELRGLADHHDEEARALDGLIAGLDAVELQSPEWLHAFEGLVATVKHHAKAEEEAKIFPLAQRALGKARALELEAKLRDATQQIVDPS